jgi:hypothetical protein
VKTNHSTHLCAPKFLRVCSRGFLGLIAGLSLCSSGIAAEDSTSELARIQVQLDTLRAQTAALESQLGGLRPAAGAGVRLAGELRLRMENFSSPNPAFVERTRSRIRLRFGGTAALADSLEAGFRFTTGVPEGEPTGNNATMQDNASKKSIALDLAYLKWTFRKTDADSLAVVAGKMNIPFVHSDLEFDSDYTPEGLALQYARGLGRRHVVRANTAVFVLDETSASRRDPAFLGGELRLDSMWQDKVATSFGVAALSVTHRDRLGNSAVPDIHKGNTRDASGALRHDYRPWSVDAAVGGTMGDVFPGLGQIPFRVSAEIMWNPAARDSNRGYFAGVVLGRLAKAGSWELGYRYRVIEADAWYEELADSDSGAFYQNAPAGGAAGYGGGTNVRGHIFSGAYAITGYATVGFTYFLTRLVDPAPAGSDSRMGRLQVNAVLKF